jgi:hypothetical protein
MLFEGLSDYAQDVPIVAIATKKDEFLGAKLMEGRRALEQRHEPVTLAALDLYGEKELEGQLCQIDKELNDFGRFDDLVAVSIRKFETCQNLNPSLIMCNIRRRNFNREPQLGNNAAFHPRKGKAFVHTRPGHATRSKSRPGPG